MTDEQKALKACANYSRLTAEVKRLTRLLSDSLSGCPGVNGHLQLPVDRLFDQAAHESHNADETHLKRAYAAETDDDGQYFLTHGEQMEVLSACPHCLAAHEAIQARKAARKSLGAAKRQIGLIGRKAQLHSTQQ
jgi:hypothetical protein